MAKDSPNKNKGAAGKPPPNPPPPEDNPPPPEDNPPPSNRAVQLSHVSVRVVGQTVGEPGGPYPKGATFPTTPERRKALGPLVENVAPPKTDS